jgi:hypothetical protein
MDYTTNIKHNEWKDGDVICFPAFSFQNEPNYDLICVVKDSKLYQLPKMNEINPDENWKCLRIDFKFISDGSWFVEGSEAYPTVPIDDSKDLWTATFVGLTNKSYNVFKGEHPRWVKEFHPINKFKIEKR